MQLVGARDDALRRGVGGGDHQIVVGEIELLDGDGKERQIAPIAGLRERKLLNETRTRNQPGEKIAAILWQVAHQRVEIGLREQADDFSKYSLSAPLDHQPVVYNRNSHADAESFGSRIANLCSSPDPLLDCQEVIIRHVALVNVSGCDVHCIDYQTFNAFPEGERSTVRCTQARTAPSYSSHARRLFNQRSVFMFTAVVVAEFVKLRNLRISVEGDSDTTSWS